MPRRRALMAGGTDYTGVSLTDILEHLRDWRRWTAETIEKLEGYRSDVERRAELLEAPREVERYINYFVDLLDRYLSDLDRVIKELPSRVRPRHVEIVEQIYRSSRHEEDRCVQFKQDYLERQIQHNEVRGLLEHIYAESRDQLIDFRDFSNLAPRLRTFVADPATADQEPIFVLRPNLWGVGLNLRPLWGRVRNFFTTGP